MLVDNRLIEENYQREMMEKEESGGEKEGNKEGEKEHTEKQGKVRKRRLHLQEPGL